MSNFLKKLVVGAGLLSLTTGCLVTARGSAVGTVGADPVEAEEVPGEVEVAAEPPAPQPETIVISTRPSVRHVWVNGHWQRAGGRWVWRRGHWHSPPASRSRWVAGHWVRGPVAWRWVAGRWE